jgi:hypothetical protein
VFFVLELQAAATSTDPVRVTWRAGGAWRTTAMPSAPVTNGRRDPGNPIVRSGPYPLGPGTPFRHQRNSPASSLLDVGIPLGRASVTAAPNQYRLSRGMPKSANPG